ncbi:hypothetical protein ACS0TY_032479 [Phlomoides rotata]
MLSCFVPFSLEVIYLSFLLTTTKDFKFGCSYLLESRVQGSPWIFNHTWEMLLKGMEFDTTHFITDVSGKYPRLWALKGAHPVTINR